MSPEETTSNTGEPVANAPSSPPTLVPFPPAVSLHELHLEDRTISYQTTFGSMPIANEKGDIEAILSYTAYVMQNGDGVAPSRPLMFLFNGGPGSSSVWLHLGGLGPRRVAMGEDGSMPPPPFQIVANPFTWLAFADLVFVDPVDTGFSKAASPELTKEFLAVEGDLRLNGEFIRKYLSQNNRWTSPLFLAGESYGTFRAAGLAGKLIGQGIAFNGVILISSVLELGTLLFESGDDLPYVVYLPTYAATAWYHQRLNPALQARALSELLQEVETWALHDYAPALAVGSKLSPARFQEVAEKLRQYTGLDQDLIIEHQLKIDGATFARNLLNDQHQTVGRLDSRHVGYDPDRHSTASQFDPSMSAIRAPFTAAFNHYLRTELHYGGDEDYHILRSLDWTWGPAEAGTPRTNNELAAAFSQNPYLRTLVTSGYYDLATPYFATHYTIGRLNIDPGIASQIKLLDYPGGHMTYVALPLMQQMRDDVEAFVSESQNVLHRPLVNG